MTQEERDRLEASQGKAWGRALSPEEIRRLADPANDPILVDSSAYRNHGVVFGRPQLFEINREHPLTKGCTMNVGNKVLRGREV